MRTANNQTVGQILQQSEPALDRSLNPQLKPIVTTDASMNRIINRRNNIDKLVKDS